MRTIGLVAVVTLPLMMGALAACGGEQPAPQPPPPPPAAPSATASAAPEATTPPPPPPKPALSELIPQTLTGINDAFNAHDAKKMAGYFTEDCTVKDFGVPDAHGRDDVTKSMQMIYDAFPDAKSVATRTWIKGNVAIAEFTWAGTMTGDLMMLKASKKPAGQIRLHVMWFNDDGLIKEEHEYGDEAGLMAQILGKKGAPPVPTLPTSAGEVHVAKGTPEEDKLADWAKGVDDTFNKDDVKAATALLADNVDYWMNTTGQPAAKGKAAVADLTRWFKAFPNQKWTTTNAWGVEGYAIVEHTMSGTQKGPIGPLPASNKPVTDWHFVDVYQPSADGKIEHGWGYANMLEMTMQTGAFNMAPKGAPAAGPGAGATKGAAVAGAGGTTKAAPAAKAPDAKPQ